MHTGDLVQHNWYGITPMIGVVVEIEHSKGGCDPLYRIKWTDGAVGTCFGNELILLCSGTLHSE